MHLGGWQRRAHARGGFRAAARYVRGALLGLLLALAALAGAAPVAAAHASPVRMDPARDAILRAPPSQVRVWYSESINPATSRLVVVDTTNRQVDSHDAHVSFSDPSEFLVDVPLLPAGTYVVAWRVQSADDGHVTGGSYIFRIARPDGSVPPIPATLPTGNIPGAGGSGAATGSGVDGPTLLQSAFTWLALALLAFWVGSVIWETWILAPGVARDGDLAAASSLAGRRFRRLAPYALGLLILANVGIVVAQAAALAGTWAGAFSAPLLRAILFNSRFGTFWWLREVVALAALALAALAPRYGWSYQRPLAHAAAARKAGQIPALTARPTDALAGTIPEWRWALVETVRGVPRLPARIAAGLRGRSRLGLAECALAGLLIVAFALSGHASAVPAPQFGYAVSVDLLHLLANAAWVGGLLYIGVVLMPALAGLEPRARARVLALGLPEFGALAILSALLLAATGSLNTTIHLTSIQQFLTTAYGRTLFIKIELFLLMVAISAYHAFWLRPQLAHALATERAAGDVALREAEEALVTATTQAAQPGQAAAKEPGAPRRAGRPLPERAAGLAQRLDDWLRREALLGVLVLLCVALLDAFAGSLATPPAGAAAAPSRGYVHTAMVGNEAITLKVDPAAFGTNTFTVRVSDPQGKAISGAAVSITTEMLDMDMGQQTTQLQPGGNSQPGVYSGQSDLTMAGHWKVTVRVLPPNSKQFQTADFTFTAGY